MKHKRVMLLLTGCLLATCISVVCASQYVVNKVIPTRGGDSTPVVESSSISCVYTTNRIDINKAMLDEYTALDFSSIEDLQTSLYSLTDIPNLETLYEERIYDASEEDIISVYRTSDESVSVVVLPDGTISSCTFEGLSEEDESQIRSLSKDSGYSFKSVTNGFMLEPDVVIV